jgi:tetratricopeptide (TPR) repeat protein
MLSGMRHKAVLVLGLVLLVMATVACSSLSPAKTAYNRGWDYAEQGDYENAIEEYDEAIRLDPQAAKAYNSRGIAYGEFGQHEQATATIVTGLRYIPTQNPRCWRRSIDDDREGAAPHRGRRVLRDA